MKLYRFWFTEGYIDIMATSEAEARKAWSSELVTLSNHKPTFPHVDRIGGTFVCFSLKSANRIEVIEL